MTEPIDLMSVLDEPHAAVLDLLPPTLLDLNDIPACRENIAGFLGQMPRPELPPGVTISEAMVPGYDGDPEVRVKVYRPDDAVDRVPAMLWIHGGGMVLMDADNDDPVCAARCAHHRMVVVSVDYRLAPETPAPGPIHDCYAALSWLAANADDLGIDTARIMIGGASAGGGLAAGTAIFARDHNGPGLAAQLLVFPMLDHRNDSASARAITDSRVWNHEANRLAWAAYLGDGEPTAYSSPAIATDLSGLPPAYVNVGSFDMFLDEDIAYARALLEAGVPTELHVYPGAFHGSSSFVPDHPLSTRWWADEEDFIARSLSPDSSTG